MSIFTLVVIAASIAPCEAYPQFPNHERCGQIVADVRRDKDDIEDVLRHFGAWFDGDGKAWHDVPLWLEKVRLRWVENQRILELWQDVHAFTHPTWEAWSLEHGPLIYMEMEQHLRTQLGDDWFDRGMMPVPLSHRGQCPKLVHVPKVDT